MNARAAYEADRAWTRQHRADRGAQGLPHHPDGTGWATCPECKGSGERMLNASSIDDPQCEYPIPCHLCAGEGRIVDGHEDPLRAMSRHRRHMRQSGRASPGFASVMYRLERERAMKRVRLPLDHAPVHPVFAEIFQTWGIAA